MQLLLGVFAGMAGLAFLIYRFTQRRGT